MRLFLWVASCPEKLSGFEIVRTVLPDVTAGRELENHFQPIHFPEQETGVSGVGRENLCKPHGQEPPKWAQSSGRAAPPTGPAPQFWASSGSLSSLELRPSSIFNLFPGSISHQLLEHLDF